MAIFANFTLNDGQATPVAHTFAANRINALGVASFVDRSAGIALGFPVITFSLAEPSKTSPNYKSISKISVPVMESTSAATGTGIAPGPTIAHVMTANINVTLHNRATLAQRNDLIAYIQGYVLRAEFINSIRTLEFVN